MLYIAVLAFTWLALADLAPKSCDGDGATSCAPGTNCLDVKVAGQPKEVCTKCESTHVPIDGGCKPKAPEEDKCSRPTEGDDGTCAACKGAYYLYKGGCYTKCPDGMYADVATHQCKDCAASCLTCEASDKGSFCTKCESTHVPIDGGCKPKAPEEDKCSRPTEGDDGTCAACKGAYYLYKGGCYTKCPDGMYADVATHQCKDCAASCLTCEASDKGSFCTKCESTHVPIDGGCKPKAPEEDKCSRPTEGDDGTCAACKGAYYLYKGGCYTKCPDGMYADVATHQCKDCAASCLTCEASDKGSFCTKCESTHVPIDGGCKPKAPEEDKCSRPTEGDDGTCAACKGAYYLYKGGCYTKCPQGTPNSETNTCDGAPAPDCNVPNCDTCSEDKRTCEACRSGYFLTPEKNDCLISCPGGSYATGRTCTPCHSTCSSCSDATENSCTTCYPGSVLSRDGGKATGACIPECTGGYAENCEATRCTAVVGGSKYCSKCRTGYAPVDGICVSTASRAPAGCTPGDGVCDACTGTYFLQSGGCYNAGTFPGNTSCIVASGDGKCATCANGQDANPQTGSCPSCPANCSKCSGNSDAKTCTECYSGYYLDAGKACKKCSETSGNIQGVPSCMSCKAPSSPSAPTPVTCYVTQQRTDDGTGGSVNKSGLTTGAIAGIAVAVVIVVGGLVGFLCWWFLCRGKA